MSLTMPSQDSIMHNESSVTSSHLETAPVGEAVDAEPETVGRVTQTQHLSPHHI